MVVSDCVAGQATEGSERFDQAKKRKEALQDYEAAFNFYQKLPHSPPPSMISIKRS